MDPSGLNADSEMGDHDQQQQVGLPDPQTHVNALANLRLFPDNYGFIVSNDPRFKRQTQNPLEWRDFEMSMVLKFIEYKKIEGGGGYSIDSLYTQYPVYKYLRSRQQTSVYEGGLSRFTNLRKEISLTLFYLECCIHFIIEVEMLRMIHATAPRAPKHVSYFSLGFVDVLERGDIVAIWGATVHDGHDQYCLINLQTMEFTEFTNGSRLQKDYVLPPAWVNGQAQGMAPAQRSVPAKKGKRAAVPEYLKGRTRSRQRKTCSVCGHVSSIEWMHQILPLRNRCEKCREYRDKNWVFQGKRGPRKGQAPDGLEPPLTSAAPATPAI